MVASTHLMIYEIIRNHLIEYGVSPTYSEIATEYGSNSASHIGNAITALVEAGMLRRRKRGVLEVVGLDVQRGPKTSPRSCLSCGNQFQSEGIGNRICTECKGLHIFSGLDEYTVAGLK